VKPLFPAWLRRRIAQANHSPHDLGELRHWIRQADLDRERARKNRRANRPWLTSGRVES
jgi:hypothetical protein